MTTLRTDGPDGRGRCWTSADVRRYRRRTADLQVAVVLAVLLAVVCSMLTGA